MKYHSLTTAMDFQIIHNVMYVVVQILHTNTKKCRIVIINHKKYYETIIPVTLYVFKAVKQSLKRIIIVFRERYKSATSKVNPHRNLDNLFQ